VLQRVLVPEAALALVMEDLDQTADEAAMTLRESARYGAGMFAQDNSAAGKAIRRGADLGYSMVRDRARARAREIAVEERIEAELLREQATNRKRVGMGAEDEEKTPTKRQRAKTRKDSQSDALSSAVQSPNKKAMPRPRPVVKTRPETSEENNALTDSTCSSEVEITSARVRTKRSQSITIVEAPSASPQSSTRSRPRSRMVAANEVENDIQETPRPKLREARDPSIEYVALSNRIQMLHAELFSSIKG
jgi:hypothetical protein